LYASWLVGLVEDGIAEETEGDWLYDIILMMKIRLAMLFRTKKKIMNK
jgi:hypothetical protein